MLRQKSHSVLTIPCLNTHPKVISDYRPGPENQINLEFLKIIWLFKIILIYLHCDKDLMNINN